MPKRKRRRAPNDGGSIDQLPSGRWRLRVRLDGRQATYGLFESEEDAFQAQARWRLVHLLPADDPQLSPEDATNVARPRRLADAPPLRSGLSSEGQQGPC